MEKTSNRLESLKARQSEINTIYKPEFLRIKDPGEKKKFLALLDLPGLMVNDHISDQVKEWIKYKNPGKKFLAKELENAAEERLNKAGPDNYGVWVYYPWSNRLVHILDEEEFIDVRTSRNQYKITLEERNILAQKKIGVV